MFLPVAVRHICLLLFLESRNTRTPYFDNGISYHEWTVWSESFLTKLVDHLFSPKQGCLEACCIWFQSQRKFDDLEPTMYLSRLHLEVQLHHYQFSARYWDQKPVWIAICFRSWVNSINTHHSLSQYDIYTDQPTFFRKLSFIGFFKNPAFFLFNYKSNRLYKKLVKLSCQTML